MPSIDKRGKEIEGNAKEFLLRKGFDNIQETPDEIGDFTAQKNGIKYRIEVKSRGESGLKIPLKHKSTQQDRLLERARTYGETPIFLVYFPENKRWVAKSAYSSKVKPYDRSLF